MLDRIIRAAITAAALLAATPSAAYWEYGHQTVAKIAYASVRPATRAKLKQLLRHGDLLGTPECAVTDIASASTWADCIKPLKDATGKPRFGYAYNWHFQDVEVCQPFNLTAPCADGNCLSTQIVRQQARLANRALPLADRVQALAFLTHCSPGEANNESRNHEDFSRTCTKPLRTREYRICKHVWHRHDRHVVESQ